MHWHRAIRTSLVVAALLRAADAAAQAGATRFEIVDNSFLVEEAFNQEAGIFQNIFMWLRGRDGAWAAGFTQEWPLGGARHQFSYTLPFANTGFSTRFDDVLLHYRLQVLDENARRPAVSPRVSLVLPTATGPSGAPGLQVNVPASKQLGDFYVHANAGAEWLREGETSTFLGASGIWRLSPMLHVMLESVFDVGNSATISPGVRRGWNFGDHQLVVGAALPITRETGSSTVSFLTYVSYELPFASRP